MKTFTISAALALLAALGQAAPAPSQAKGRQFEVQLTFTGAGPNPPIFTLAEPADGSIFEVDNALSVSTITSAGGAVCTIYGADGSATTIVGSQTVNVGPPQTQVSGACSAF
ncbi:hypothetical protein MMC28_006874 [Mycoblastus sanguinarius]|nr:hypothetical protein [Mycoblastus sanguinarius]